MEHIAETRLSSPIQDESRRLLNRVKSACKQFNIVSLKRRMEACESLLVENPPIDVAILGQFKAGKSSFLNSLIGKAILPVGVIPVTTVITRLQYGEKEEAIASHFDGRKIKIALPKLGDYTSEAENPSNEKNVEVVDISLPSLKEYDGLRLVDTPGLGSVFKSHMETSEHWLPEVGAALLAVSADRPLSENDLKLLRELTQHTPRIVLLLTKADLLTPEEQATVVRFFKATLNRELNQDLPIYLYSTRSDTDKFRCLLEEEIFFKLSMNRESEFRRMLQHKTRSLVKSCLGYLEIALKTAMQADVDRDALRKQVLDERVSYDLISEELFIISRESRKQTRVMIIDYLETFKKPLRKKLMEELSAELPRWKGNLWQLTRHYEEWVAERMTEEMRHISKREHRHFYGTIKKAHALLSRTLESFRALLDQNVRNALGVTLAEVEWSIEVSKPEHPDIKAVRSFDYHFDLIWFLIPMFIFRSLFEGHFVRKIPWEVEANLSRLAAQWEERINKTIEGMRKQALRYVQDELTPLESLLSRVEGQTEQIRRTIDEIEKQLNSLSVQVPAP